MTPRQLLGRARVRIFEHLPYICSYAYALREQETPGIKTAAVDAHGVLYWDPEYIASLDTDTGAYLIVHETLHLLFEHHQRSVEIIGENAPETTRYIMNVAADLVIEQTLSMMRHVRPKGAVHLGAYVPRLKMRLDFPENRSMPEYYRLICERLKQGDDAEEQPDGGDGQSDGGPDGQSDNQSDDQSDGQSGGQGAGEQSSAPPSAPDGQQDGQGDEGAPPPGQAGSGPQGGAQEPGAPGAGGSCADGQPREYEVEPDGTWEAYGSDMAAAAADQAIVEYESSNPGKVPGNIKQALSQKVRPKTDPFDQLRSAVCSSVASPIGARDFSRRRRSRKQPPGDDQPLLHGRICNQPKAVVIVDTSGSMDDEETKAKALGVIAQGLRKLSRVKVFCADTKVRSNAMVTNTSRFEWHGGGGTNMAVAIKEVERTEQPDSIVLITDAATEWDYERTRTRIVVAFTGEEGDRWHKMIPEHYRTICLKQ